MISLAPSSRLCVPVKSLRLVLTNPRETKLTGMSSGPNSMASTSSNVLYILSAATCLRARADLASIKLMACVDYRMKYLLIMLIMLST